MCQVTNGNQKKKKFSNRLNGTHCLDTLNVRSIRFGKCFLTFNVHFLFYFQKPITLFISIKSDSLLMFFFILIIFDVSFYLYELIFIVLFVEHFADYNSSNKYKHQRKNVSDIYFWQKQQRHKLKVKYKSQTQCILVKKKKKTKTNRKNPVTMPFAVLNYKYSYVK